MKCSCLLTCHPPASPLELTSSEALAKPYISSFRNHKISRSLGARGEEGIRPFLSREHAAKSPADAAVEAALPTSHLGLGPFALMAVTGNRLPAAAPPISHPSQTAGSPGFLRGYPGRGARSRGRGQGPCAAAAEEDRPGASRSAPAAARQMAPEPRAPAARGGAGAVPAPARCRGGGGSSGLGSPAGRAGGGGGSCGGLVCVGRP